jgi:hypothetical protein
MTKQFTAIAILMLEEQGKLSTTDVIAKYLPDYPNGQHQPASSADAHFGNQGFYQDESHKGYRAKGDDAKNDG